MMNLLRFNYKYLFLSVVIFILSSCKDESIERLAICHYQAFVVVVENHNYNEQDVSIEKAFSIYDGKINCGLNAEVVDGRILIENGYFIEYYDDENKYIITLYDEFGSEVEASTKAKIDK
ncbi:hypothetical protein DU002_04540 [Corallincola holothuriorum]|uniref:Lipoprotein n=1 Tax=Corallincola holothuriorum TaxID=2282215 RepID=A0A368NPC4_9GAMM|nr:hypothetical protein [Corallincola holothuriorum]RCU51743.1 hypothetical protein DU002_04540 [Corallincola holothuriorum]